MVLEIVHLILLAATLACGLVVSFYARRIQAAEERGLAFQEIRDGDQRRYRLEARNLQRGWQKDLRDWLGDSRAILEKLHSIAAESDAQERRARLAPPVSSPLSLSLSPAPETSRMGGSAPVSRERPSPGAPRQSTLRAVAARTSTPTLAPGSARPVPWIETKHVCRECDAGYVAVGNGGIGPCYACEGSGFIHAV